MSENEGKELKKVLWDIADKLRGSMDADDFRDYMLGFLFLKYISNKYEAVAEKFLKNDVYSGVLKNWYDNNKKEGIERLEKMIKTEVGYLIEPQYLWGYISLLAKKGDSTLLETLADGFKHIEKSSLGMENDGESSLKGLFSEVNLDSDKLGKTQALRNKTLCTIISTLDEGMKTHSMDKDELGDAYEYLIGQFAAGSGKKAGEFYTPQAISSILSKIVVLDCQKPEGKPKKELKHVLDFACGSGSLLLNVVKQMGIEKIGNIYGQEKNITTYNLARMNMLLHDLPNQKFRIFHGDTLTNDWEMLSDQNPRHRVEFDAIVANPPFSYRWEPKDEDSKDSRFSNYGVAPKSAADFAFLLHGFHYLSSSGTMAIILPHGVLFRGGVEERIRTKLLKEGSIDTIIGLPSNLFFSTGIPVCILVLKKCKKADNVLFINASEHFEKGKQQNILTPKNIDKIIDTYKHRKEEDKYSKQVSLKEIEENDFNLNLSRYIDMSEEEEEINLEAVQKDLKEIEKNIATQKKEVNSFLKELGLKELP